MENNNLNFVKLTVMSIFIVCFGIIYLLNFDKNDFNNLLNEETSTIIETTTIKQIKHNNYISSKSNIIIVYSDDLINNQKDNEYLINIVPYESDNEINNDDNSTHTNEKSLELEKKLNDDILNTKNINSSKSSVNKYKDDNVENFNNDKSFNKNNNLININTAQIDELKSLPSIGDTIAKLIIEYRNEYGKFTDISQIKNVKKIGNKTYEKIKDLITVD